MMDDGGGGRGGSGGGQKKEEVAGIRVEAKFAFFKKNSKVRLTVLPAVTWVIQLMDRCGYG
jgi:hypothetical protein